MVSGFVGRLGETMVYSDGFGDLLRVTDGKLLLSDPMLCQQPPCWDQKNEMLFKHVHSTAFYGYQVLAEGETLRLEKRWGIPNAGKTTVNPRYSMRNDGQVHAPVSYRDRTYMGGYIYDCTTGDVLAGEDRRPNSPIIDAVTGKEKTPTHEHAVKTFATPATRMQYLLADDRVWAVASDDVNNKPFWKDPSVRSKASVQIFTLDGKKIFEGRLRNPPFDHPAVQRVHEQGIFPRFFSYSGSFSLGRDAIYVRGVTHLRCLSENK